MSPEEEKRFDVLADRVMSTTAAALDFEIPTAPTAPSQYAAFFAETGTRSPVAWHVNGSSKVMVTYRI